MSAKDRFKLVPNAERVAIINPVHKPFLQLQSKIAHLSREVKKDLDFCNGDLKEEMMLRSRTEIATYFRNHDPVATFLNTLAPLNPANAGIENTEEKWITCDMVATFMENALAPEPIPAAVIKKIYSTLVGNSRR